MTYPVNCGILATHLDRTIITQEGRSALARSEAIADPVGFSWTGRGARGSNDVFGYVSVAVLVCPTSLLSTTHECTIQRSKDEFIIQMLLISCLNTMRRLRHDSVHHFHSDDGWWRYQNRCKVSLTYELPTVHLYPFSRWVIEFGSQRDSIVQVYIPHVQPTRFLSPLLWCLPGSSGSRPGRA